LKSYLRKHRDMDVNFSRGKRQRSPLQLACSLEDDGVLRLLLKHGADVLQRDRRGDTALHIAVNRALKHGKTGEELKACAGLILILASGFVLVLVQLAAESMSRPPESNLEKEWLEKLLGECEEEFFETDDNLPVDEEEEDFGDWADRIRRDYFNKKHAEAQRLASTTSEWKKENSRQKEESNRELHERLQREHEEYLARAARKEEETRRGKKRQYDEKCAATFSAAASASASMKLSYGDIPWPSPRGTVQEMLDVMLHGVDRKDEMAFRKALRKQQALWHPDKFAQRCEARLEEKDKKRILDTVTSLSQELNSLAQSLKT
ncbi:hypothetical protein XENOCAPTIV_006687, partial [Xenoophorus captivus]